jgi:hypothetical protein
MKEQIRLEPAISAAAERQMHAWAMTSELKDRAVRSDLESRAPPRTRQYVAISREAGAGGGEIGQCLGRRLGWDVFDKNLLDYVAERFHLSRLMLDLVDETESNWVYDVLGTWMDRQIVPHEKYFVELCRTVSALARRGHAVFVGRGAQFLLPRDRVLAVRLIASLRYRVQKIILRTGLKEKEAERRATELDAGRREFVERFLRRDITDPHNYDLVINVERCSQETVVAEILAALQ